VKQGVSAVENTYLELPHTGTREELDEQKRKIEQGMATAQ
jgi:hypothetical protein